MPDQRDDELELRPSEEKPKRKRAAKAPPTSQSDGSTVRVENAFKAGFEQRYKFPIGNVLYKPARDRKILKTMVADLGEPEVLALIQDFFFTYSGDRHIKFVTRAGTVRNFQSCLERLIVLRHGQNVDLDDRAAANRREIDKAMGKKP